MKNTNEARLDRLCRSLLGSLLALALMFTLAVPAFADGFGLQPASEVDDEEAMEEADESQRTGLADSETAAWYLLDNLQSATLEQTPTDESSGDFPATLDLRDRGVVTPVKFQNPFGSCWGFAAIAACETSILSSMGKTYEETGLDLSEHQLAWFARTYLQDGSSQDGEGVHMFNESDTLNTGGCPFYASSLFSSGIGPVSENLIPYRGLNSLTDADGLQNYCYSDQDDWSIPEDYKFVSSYELIESSELPSPAVYSVDEDGNYVYEGYDASATEAWKQELMEGRAISIAFCADDYEPGGFSLMPLYLNTDDNAWAHYTFDTDRATHAVCVVGWDDTFPASRFLDHSEEEYGDGEAHQPEGDGAWIVKNSWGSENSDFPNRCAWGVEDENGNHTGYFYISYYDRSLSMAETFTFDVSERDYESYMIDQYDYMPSNSTNGWLAEDGMQMANVFTAEADGNIVDVSCETNIGDASVTYEVYLLDDDALYPDDGMLAASVEADYPYAGYHKAALDEPVAVKQGQRYSVVVTSCVQSEDTLYYELCAQIADNQEYVEEYNRQIRYSNRNLPESDYEGSLLMYYSKGIVNPGESYVYLDTLGQWADFAELIPYLREDEKFDGYDFDNFPVKAYLTYADEAAAAAATEGYMTSELNYAAPAGNTNTAAVVHLVLRILAGLALVALVAFAVERAARRRRELKRLRAEVKELKAELGKETAPDAAEKAAADPGKTE